MHNAMAVDVIPRKKKQLDSQPEKKKKPQLDSQAQRKMDSQRVCFLHSGFSSASYRSSLDW